MYIGKYHFSRGIESDIVRTVKKKCHSVGAKLVQERHLLCGRSVQPQLCITRGEPISHACEIHKSNAVFGVYAAGWNGSSAAAGRCVRLCTPPLIG